MVTDAIEQRVELALEGLRPFLKEDGGDIELVEISEDMVVSVMFKGACTTCAMTNMTMAGIEDAIIKSVPEINNVIQLSAHTHEKI